MSFLNLDGGSGSAHIVERLNLERTKRTAKSVGFDAVDVNEAILQAAVLLFRDRQQQHTSSSNQQAEHNHHQPFTIDSGRRKRNSIKKSGGANKQNGHNYVKLEKLCINNCPANPFLEYLIEASMGMDLFREFELQGNMEEEEEQAAELEAAANARLQQREAEAEAQAAANNKNNNTCGEDGLYMENGDFGLGGDNDDGDGDDEDESESDVPTPSQSSIFALDALGFRMRFSRRLRKVELINLPITRDHAESLMYGIETNDVIGTGCRLDTLVMEGVRFVDEEEDADEDEHDVSFDTGLNIFMDNEQHKTPGDGTVVVKEFCEGFPNNRTLETIKLERCRLTDAQIALVFNSLARHPTLKHLNLSESSCRNLGLEALDRMFVSPLPKWMLPLDSPTISAAGVANDHSCTSSGGGSSSRNHCKIESLDLSYQFTSEETYGTGEHIQLDILTRNCTTKDVDERIYPNLRKLVLQGNQIDDSDMKHLAFLIRHRFPQLEELDLRFNEITTGGLENFANHSDPNNDLYLTSNNDNNNSNNSSDPSNFVKKYKTHFPPPSSRLRTIRLTNNPLVMTNQTSVVILRLLKIYPELQLIQSNLEWEDGTSIAKYIQHLLDINRAGRVLLLAGSNGHNTNTSNGVGSDEYSKDSINSIYSPSARDIRISSLSTEEKRRREQQSQQQRRPIPLGAWPLVLARLTRQSRYPHYIPVKNSLNGMYYLIRHGSIIMEEMALGASNVVSNKKNNAKNGSSKNKREEVSKRKWGDPALGGYATLADFLRCELGA